MGTQRWIIRFRYLPPMLHHVPLIYIPIEQTWVEAASADEAWQKFLANQEHGHDDFSKEEVYLDGTWIETERV